MKLLIYLILLTLFVLNASAQPPKLKINGSPLFNTSGITVTEAGNDFNSNLEEAQPNTTIDIDNGNQGNDYFFVFVRLVQPLSSSATISIKRTGNGSSSQGLIDGGLAYLALSTNEQLFFYGSKAPKGIPIMFQIGDVSVVNPFEGGNVPVIFRISATNN